MKTQKAILKRIEDAQDLFGAQEEVLVSFLEFDNACLFLSQDKIKQVVLGHTTRRVHRDPVKDIKDFFTYKLPSVMDSVSAARWAFKLRALVWLDGVHYKEFNKLFVRFTNGYLCAEDIFTFVKNAYKVQTTQAVEKVK